MDLSHQATGRLQYQHTFTVQITVDISELAYNFMREKKQPSEGLNEEKKVGQGQSAVKPIGCIFLHVYIDTVALA